MKFISTTKLKIRFWPSNNMPLKYLIREVVINERFARSQKVSWADQKRIIFEITKELAQNVLFGKADVGEPNYNLASYHTETPSSLGIMPLTPDRLDDLLKSRLLDGDEAKINDAEVNASNYQNNSFIFLFRMALVRHEDINLFMEGRTRQLWEYIKGEDTGRLSLTAFGIVVSEHLQKIFIIKQSGGFENIGYGELLYYLNEKSQKYRQNRNINNSFNLVPVFSAEGFDAEEVASIISLDVGVNSDLINEYRTRSGAQDAFFSIILSPFSKLFGTGRTTKFGLVCSEEGDPEAVELFKNLYSSFSSIEGEELEKIFTTFKLIYESTSGNECSINFKRDRTYCYKPDSSEDDFKIVFDAFRWISGRLHSRTGDAGAVT